MVVNISRYNKGQSSIERSPSPLGKSAMVAWAAMELRNSVGSIRKDLTPAV
jgi:hypothetical protein